jgi:putative ATPase
MDLFDQANQERMETEAPLAARMRPRSLDDFVGQEYIVGPGRLLRRAIQADQLGSLIFYGPPGTGKTTLAQVIANTTRAHFIALNAVLSGVKEIREAIAEAQERSKHYAQRTILFVDEVHRFNKAQQDALLPWVENGTVIFIGATTENPYFEVNKALVSRSRIFQLQSLGKEDLRTVVLRALSNSEYGYGNRPVVVDQDALEHLINVAGGDARGVLNALELSIDTTQAIAYDGAEHGKTEQLRNFSLEAASETPAAITHVTLAIAEESIQRRAVLYDKEGDYHYDTISAFIKSLRGSDPDAVVYWMAKMIYAGESPRFIFRRMLIFAGEDVGLADPNAIQVVTACAAAFEQVGMPEGRFHLATAALYLATAKKSNSAFAFFDALSTVEKEADSGVPNHLRDGNRDAEGFGHGEGYLYPHAYRDHWVAQQYLPSSLQGKVFYQPSDQGYEAGVQTEVARRREAQLAAMLAVEGEITGEILTWSPNDPDRDRWLQRTISNAGERLGVVRDRVLDGALLARHSNVLDLKAGSGLLTWEAVRRTPEGTVVALARQARDAEALTQLAQSLDAVEQPQILLGTPSDLPDLLVDQEEMRFEAIVGYNALIDMPDKEAAIAMLIPWLTTDGMLSLAERIPRHTQRLHALVDLSRLDPELAQRVRAAEEAIYTDPDDPLINWESADLVNAAKALGLPAILVEEAESSEVPITAATVDRWFEPSTSGRPSYGDRLGLHLDADEIAAVRRLFRQQLVGQSVEWSSHSAFLRVGNHPSLSKRLDV